MIRFSGLINKGLHTFEDPAEHARRQTSRANVIPTAVIGIEQVTPIVKLILIAMAERTGAELQIQRLYEGTVGNAA
jgi:hypothetical protein